MTEWMWCIWLAVFVIAIIVESLGPEVVSIWFAIGALVALIISFFSAWWVQLIVFSVISIVLIFALRPFIKKYINKNPLKSNVEEIILAKGVVTKKATSLEHGTCLINDVTWTIVPCDENDIEVGEIVEVVSISGNKLIVRSVSNIDKEKEKQK